MQTSISTLQRPNIWITENSFISLNNDYPALKISTLTYRMSMPKLKKQTKNLNHMNGSIDAPYGKRATFEDRVLEVDFLCQCEDRNEAVRNIDDFLAYTGHKQIHERFWKREIRIDNSLKKTLEGYPDDVIIEQIFGGVFKFTLTWIVYPLAKSRHSSAEMFNTYLGSQLQWNELCFKRELNDRQVIIPAFFLTEKEQEFKFVVPNPIPKSIRFTVSGGSCVFRFNGGAEHKLHVWIDEAQDFTNQEIELSEIQIFADGSYYKNTIIARGTGVLLVSFTTEELLYV